MNYANLKQLRDRQLVSTLSARSQWPKRIQHVYVIRIGPLCKIGIALDPAARFRNMQLPERPEVLGTFPCDDAGRIERTLHRRFAAERKHGEWFDLTKARTAELLFWCRVLSAS